MKFTCRGEIRGDCGIIHRSYKAATNCIKKDQKSVRKSCPSIFPTKAFSDRYIEPLDKEAENFFKLEIKEIY